MAKVPVAAKPKSTKDLEYVGPDYTHGIRPPGGKGIVKPRDFTPDQVAKFIETYPTCADWWANKENLPAVTATDTEVVEPAADFEV